jgi:hypothetical protein
VLHSIWLPVHVSLAIFGDALLALACSASVLYLVQDRRLKAHRVRGLHPHLPSLETLDRLSHRSVVWGLVLLTLAILTGIVWARGVGQAAQNWGDPKLCSRSAPGPSRVVLLQGRMAAGWRAASCTTHHRRIRSDRASLVGVNASDSGGPEGSSDVEARSPRHRSLAPHRARRAARAGARAERASRRDAPPTGGAAGRGRSGRAVTCNRVSDRLGPTRARRARCPHFAGNHGVAVST